MPLVNLPFVNGCTLAGTWAIIYKAFLFSLINIFQLKLNFFLDQRLLIRLLISVRILQPYMKSSLWHRLALLYWEFKTEFVLWSHLSLVVWGIVN